MPRLTIRQALEMQAACYKSVKLLEADLNETKDKAERARTATALGGLARNWTTLLDSIRVLKGEPLPGSLRPEKRQNHRPSTRTMLAERAELGGD